MQDEKMAIPGLVSDAVVVDDTTVLPKLEDTTKKEEPEAGKIPSIPAPQVVAITNDEESPEMTSKLALAGIDSSALNFTGGSLKDLTIAAEMMIEGGFLPVAYTEPAQVIAAARMSNELGFSPLVGINNINVIQGKPTLSAAGMGALVRRAGWAYELIQHPDPDNGWVAKIKFTNLKAYDKWEARLDYVSGLPIESQAMYASNLSTLEHAAYQVHEYSWARAEAAGYTKKPNWTKLPAEMIISRCLTSGARLVAQDALLGMYETTEIADNAAPGTIDIEAVQADIEKAFE